MDIPTRRHRFHLTHFIAAIAVCIAIPAHADFVFSSIDYPGVDYSAGGHTQLFSIDNDGLAVGNAQITASSPEFSFRYDIKHHLFARLPDYATGADCYTFAGGINAAGTSAGGESQDSGATEFAYVFKQGTFELLSRPGSKTFTEARAINSQGLISGYALNDADGTYSGFLYDPVSNSWIDVLPSLTTIAQGLNAHDELVGSVYENAAIVCAVCRAGPYGFIRAANGSIAIFTVNGKLTYARGITDAGMITGFALVDNQDVGFVISAPTGAGYRTVQVPAKDLVRFPGAAGTTPEGISNDGTLSGSWTDSSGALHGFIAAPKSP